MRTIVDSDIYEEIWFEEWYAVETHEGCWYAACRLNEQVAYLHRYVMGLESKQLIDHKDGNGLNNLRSNLRFCSAQQNCFNRSSNKKSTSKFKGVCWASKEKKWLAQIQFNGKNMRLGGFSEETEAAKAYNKAALELFGEFARINNI